MKLHQFMTMPELAGEEFSGASWATWRVIARLIDGDAQLLTDDERALALKLTGRRTLPTQAPREVYIGAGRRGGKSRFGALVATWLTAREYPQLAPGEVAIAAHVAPDRRQAQLDLDYARGLVEASELLSTELANATAETLSFRHRTMLEVATASYRTVRGRTLCGAVIDESAFLRSDDSALPDLELARALRPALLTLGGLLLVISSPHRKIGLLHDAYRRFFGQDAEQRGLYILASSLELNPTLDEQAIAEAMSEDPEAARSEFMAEFRTDLSAWLSEELIAAALEERARPLGGERVTHVGFVDMSGGRHDASALGIAHLEQQAQGPPLAVLDHIEAVPAPHEPHVITERFAAALRNYGISNVTGDRYGAAWVSDAFKACGINYAPSELDKSAVYAACLPLFTERRAQLVPDKRLLTELRLLERKPRAGGRGDAVDHPPGGHDDAANAACGALWCAGALNAPPGGLIREAMLLVAA